MARDQPNQGSRFEQNCNMNLPPSELEIFTFFHGEIGSVRYHAIICTTGGEENE